MDGSHPQNLFWFGMFRVLGFGFFGAEVWSFGVWGGLEVWGLGVRALVLGFGDVLGVLGFKV